jgi:K+-transporting ATPase KdpF subunit
MPREPFLTKSSRPRSYTPPRERTRRRASARHSDAGGDGALLRGLLRFHLVAGARMNVADVLELALSVAMLGYLFYALIRPERF